MRSELRKLITSIGVAAIILVGYYGMASGTRGMADSDMAHSRIPLAPATGPLRVSSINPRYFADSSGKIIYLTGSHTWNNLQSIRGLLLPGGFSGYLAWLHSYNHNFIRFWILEHAWDKQSGAVISPHPWPRTGPGQALDGRLKFDLTKFDTTYFNRLRQRAAAAGNRGFYVSIMLFDDWSTENPGPWKGHPFNVNNNINGVNGDPDNDGLGLEFHTLQIPAITQLQEAYVKKVVDTVNDLDNVLYEIANETGISKAWQYHMMNVIKQYEIGKPKQHPVGMTVGWPVLEVDNTALFASSADWISPNSEGGYRDNPPAADGSKVIITDTDHLWGIGGDRTWVWKSFLRGLHPIYMDRLDSAPTRQAARKAMGDTLTYAKRMHLEAMIPRQDLASSGYCLANPGVEYLVYLPCDPQRKSQKCTVTVDLSTALGALSVEWFNPRTGQTMTKGGTTGGASRSFKAPFRGDAVLYLDAHSRY